MADLCLCITLFLYYVGPLHLHLPCLHDLFSYFGNSGNERGGFTFAALAFRWKPIPSYEKQRLVNKTMAVR